MTDDAETPGASAPNPTRPELRLDSVVASCPDLGPSPPDGGYGWLILASAVIYNISIPSLTVAYGLILVKTNKESFREDDETPYSTWEQSTGLVAALMLVVRLLLESWCRALAEVCHQPRMVALAGLCLTAAGVMLSSFATNPDDNRFTINLFSGIFAGAGWALTGQQSELIIQHYFKNRLEMCQRIYRAAPSLGYCLAPLLSGFLCSVYTSDIALTIYGAVVMQNCFFLASFTRPIYVTRPVTRSYRVLRDAVEDEDEDIFTKAGTTQVAQEPSDRRFSTNFTDYVQNQQELTNMDGVPSSLYRETTVSGQAFHPVGSVRRVDSVRRGAVSVASMLKDSQFYMHTLLQLNCVFSGLAVYLLMPAMFSERLPSLSTAKIGSLTSSVHALPTVCALLLLAVSLPRSLHKAAKLCAVTSVMGAIGTYGVGVSQGRGWLAAWGALASAATVLSSTLLRPLHDYETLTEFDVAATSFAANFVSAAAILLWCNIDIEYTTCFYVASVLQVVSACVFIGFSLIRRR